MKLKIYTLTTLCLLFIVKISAQSIYSTSSINNQIDLTLLVEDGPSRQEFSLLAEDYHDVFHEVDFITYNIRLDYQAGQNITSYFRLRCHFEELASIEPLMTATSPVIIPPVKKKKREARKPTGDYPHLAKIIYRLHRRVYEVTIELLKYKTFDDYNLGTDNYIVSTSKVIYVDARHDIPSNRNASIITYPNPSVDYLTIQFTDDITEHTPLEVVIFNHKGVKMSQHTLVNSGTKTNSTSYNLDTSHLQKGTYYFQLSHGGKTQIKTIVKE